jgi:hypothetical protein
MAWSGTDWLSDVDEPSMSALGHEQTLGCGGAMSALSPKEDIRLQVLIYLSLGSPAPDRVPHDKPCTSRQIYFVQRFMTQT